MTLMGQSPVAQRRSYRYTMPKIHGAAVGVQRFELRTSKPAHTTYMTSDEFTLPSPQSMTLTIKAVDVTPAVDGTDLTVLVFWRSEIEGGGSVDLGTVTIPVAQAGVTVHVDVDPVTVTVDDFHGILFQSDWHDGFDAHAYFDADQTGVVDLPWALALPIWSYHAVVPATTLPTDQIGVTLTSSGFVLPDDHRIVRIRAQGSMPLDGSGAVIYYSQVQGICRCESCTPATDIAGFVNDGAQGEFFDLTSNAPSPQPVGATLALHIAWSFSSGAWVDVTTIPGMDVWIDAEAPDAGSSDLSLTWM